MSFRTNGTDDRMRILSNGNIGIGTTSPSAPLDVVTNSNVYAAEFTQSKTTNGDGVFISVGSTAAADYALTVRSNAGNTSGLAVKADGNVGIGTFTPSYKLQVSGTGGTRMMVENTDTNWAALDIRAGGNQSNYVFFKDNSAERARIQVTDGNDISFHTGNSPTKMLEIASGGNVTLGGGTASENVLTVGRTGSGGQGAAHLKMKTQGASYMDWWDAGDGNTIRLYTYSVNFRMKDMPNNDPCIQFEAAGNIDIDGSYLSGGFDYAEFFESTDGTAIPVGTSVVLVNEKVRAATSGEQPLGVVRPGKDGTSVVGGAAHLKWDGKYLKDDYDAYLYDTVDYWTWKDVGDTNNTGDEDQQCWSDRVPAGWVVPSDKTVKPTQRKRLNPDFVENLDADGEQIYVNREERDEWNCIGLLGQVPITKGQVTNSNWTKLKDRSATVELWFIK